VFSVDEREGVRQELLDRAEADSDITAAAITGSHVSGSADEWSDIDLALAIRGELSAVLERWTKLVYEDFGALHHWDLPWGPTIYRVFLRRALTAAATALAEELERTDSPLAARLRPMLTELTGR
jgi:predicted nucleotidyltransferase